MRRESLAVIIVAAGSASRMGGIDKQLVCLGGVPVLVRTVGAFAACKEVEEIVVVCREDQKLLFQELLDKFHDSQVVKLTTGGDTRQKSVQRGLEQISPEIAYLGVHDGARPLVTSEIISRCLEEARRSGAACAGVRLKDTIKEVNSRETILSTPNRDVLRLTQTPQIFLQELYRKAMKRAVQEEKEYTDDCQLVEALGVSVQMTEGSYENLKITTREDLVLAEALLDARTGKNGNLIGQKEKEGSGKGDGRKMSLRIGHGYDVHALVEGRKLMIGGVEIPWKMGLAGHSDADVLVHAVIDSLLGAAALGDIGKLFPDTDPAYRGADSILLLQQVISILEEKGYCVGNVDSTVIAQAPKLGPYLLQMRTRLAQTCKVELEAVNVKATTEERLGFTGRMEGIAAHAVCTLLPLAERTDRRSHAYNV